MSLQITLSEGELEALAALVAPLVPKDNGFLGVTGAAEYLDTTPKALYALVERQKLPAHRVGRRLLFDRAELRAYVESR